VGGLLRVRRYRRGISLLTGTQLFRSLSLWARATPPPPRCPAGIGSVETIEGAGHYTHAQSPDEVAALVIPFLKEHAGA
jgi:pimeloyl-ACP methyl ester carboxylesterase